jgi:hypothetical protein
MPAIKACNKPCVVEAFQMTKKTRQDNSEWPNWLHKAWNTDPDKNGALFPTKAGSATGTVSINTLEGPQLVNFGDYIIQGVNGELYPCKPDIFLKKYDIIEED